MTVSIKKIILNLFVIMACLITGSGTASAAIFKCELQENACNEQGDHYLCHAFAWIAMDDFCSATDVTTQRPRPQQLVSTAAATTKPDIPSLTCSEECQKLPNPTKAFLCEIYRCGSW